MGKQNLEVVGTNASPTDTEVELLIDHAVARIEIIEGAEYLDGWPLPPNNTEPWEPRVIQAQTTVLKTNETTGKLESTLRSYEFTSTLSNKVVRRTNVRCIALGLGPLYITWEQLAESLEDTARQRQTRFEDSWKGRAAKFFGLKLST